MDYSPPPLFKQGASARARAIFFAFLSIFLLVLDSRLESLTLARQLIGTLLYPVQMVAVMPGQLIDEVSHYFVSSSQLEKDNLRLKRQQTLNADTLQQTNQLRAENTHLRKLLDAREHQAVKTLLTEIIYDARDPSTRKVIVDRGIKDGVALSMPVIDDQGVVGQVTRVFPLTSEVTLLSDKNQAIPVQIARNGLRSIVYGRGQSNYLDMRVTTNADVQPGDQLVTSGIDGIYPAGLAVAKVVQVENKATTTFENVLCAPAAGLERNRQLLILQVDTNNLPAPDTEDVRAKKEKLNRKVTRDAALPMADNKPVIPATPINPQSASAAAPASVAAQSPAQPAPQTGKPGVSNTVPDAGRPAVLHKEAGK